MSLRLMLEEGDARRIDALAEALGANGKIEVVRAALDLLEGHVERRKRVLKWEHAAAEAHPESLQA